MNSKIFISAVAICLAAVVGWIVFAPDTQPPTRALYADYVPNAAAGQTAFKRYCTGCHQVVTDAGEKLAGGAAKAGPNLYALPGRTAGSVQGFRYSSALTAADFRWAAPGFIAYVQDPSATLKYLTGDESARSKMAFRLRGDAAAVNAADIYAWLEGL
ncbi:MAG: c-type cytochrome [Planktomarina sp.]